MGVERVGGTPEHKKIVQGEDSKVKNLKKRASKIHHLSFEKVFNAKLVFAGPISNYRIEKSKDKKYNPLIEDVNKK